jgi:hypothetical protein
MDKIHAIEFKGIDDKVLELVVDGDTYSIDLARESKKLADATPSQVKDFIISPSGYGIHWPQIDEDLAIDPMIGIQHKTPVWKVAEDVTDYKTKKDKP